VNCGTSRAEVVCGVVLLVTEPGAGAQGDSHSDWHKKKEEGTSTSRLQQFSERMADGE
jgi:hypothetical protein